MKNSIYKSATLTLAVIALFLFATHSAQAQTAQEIREMIPEREKQISQGCEGASVAIEVDFASFNADALAYVPSQGLEEVAYGFVRFCTDSDNTSRKDAQRVGKLKTKVTKVVLRYVKDPAKKNVAFKGGAVVVTAAFGESGGTFGAFDIQSELIRLL